LGNQNDRVEENKPLIYREEGSAHQNVMEHYFASRDADRQQEAKWKLTSNKRFKQAVIAGGLVYSIMPLDWFYRMNYFMVRCIFWEDGGLPIKTEMA